MVKLRLRRRGRKKRPVYDIVAMDSRKRRDGEHLEVVGQYNPVIQPSGIIINIERALYWLKVGAQPTDTVRHLLSVQGIMLQLHLERKGKTQVEIDTAIAQHKTTVSQRLQRISTKKSQKASKKKVEAATKAAAETTTEPTVSAE